MPLPRFSEALVERRLQLGLSIAQASRTLKLREDVLVAFEEGDYDHMPQSGYAQGMLSSYARYLGLNAREIVDIFQEEIYEYRHGISSHELRRRTRQTQSGRGVSGYDMPNEAGSRPKAYVEYRPLLPSGGGPAGDMGDFATTAPARPRTSVPLAGTSAAASARGRIGDTSEFLVAHERSYVRSQGYASSHEGGYDRSAGTSSTRGDRYARPHNSAPAHEHASPGTARRRLPASRRQREDQASRLINERQYRSTGRDGSRYLRDDVSTRRVRRGEYTDDLRLDDRPRPSVPASTVSGRRSSRNIASVERPNVRRRPNAGRGGVPPRRPPVGGVAGRFLSDPRRTLLLLMLLLAVVLTAIVIFSVSSCVNAHTPDPEPGQVVPVEDVESKPQDDAPDDEEASSDGDAEGSADGQTDSVSDDADGQTDEQQGADDAEEDTSGEEKVPEKTVVDVSVARGSVTWIEITCDGRSEVADSVTGPWRQTYTVTDSITIQATSPDVVTVSENGQRVDFSPRAGGLGSVTIEGTPLPEEDEEGLASDGTGEGESTQDDGAASQ